MKILNKQQQNLFIIFSSIVIYLMLGKISIFVQHFDLVYFTLFFAFIFNLLTFTLPLILVYLLSLYYTPKGQEINFIPLYLFVICLAVLLQSNTMDIVFAFIPNFGYHELENSFLFSCFTFVFVVKFYVHTTINYKLKINDPLLRQIGFIILLIFLSILTYLFTILIVASYHHFADKYIILFLSRFPETIDVSAVFSHLFVWFNSIFAHSGELLLPTESSNCLTSTCTFEYFDNMRLVFIQNIVLIPLTTFFIYRLHFKNNFKFSLYLFIMIVATSMLMQIDFLFYLLVSYMSIPLFLLLIGIEFINTIFVAQINLISYLLLLAIEIVAIFIFIHSMFIRKQEDDVLELEDGILANTELIRQLDYHAIQSIDLRAAQIIILHSRPEQINLSLFPNCEIKNNLLILHYSDDNLLFSDYRICCFNHYQYLNATPISI